jgi:hypothetical protein
MRRHDQLPTAIDEVLEEAHLAIALLAGTVVASPVLLAALSGRREVASTLGLYVAAIVASWVVVGLIGGALSLAGARGTDQGASTDPASGHSASPAEPSAASTAEDAVDPAREPDPATTSR